MANYYVATTGSNAANGAIGTPWLTLTYALTQVGAGDTIHMREGSYNENVLITSGGSDGSPITIKAYDAGGGSGVEEVWLDGDNYTLPPGTNIIGKTIKQGTYYDANYTGMLEIRASYIVVDGINIRKSRGRGIEFYIATFAGGAHITDIIVKNLIIEDTRQSAIVGQGADNLTIQNVTAINNCNYAPFLRGPKILNHPAAVNFKWCTGVQLLDYTVHSGWGEGLILSF
jgi:hypothetical protein